MVDIFISYASEDRSRVEPLAKALDEQGWSVWWDKSIPPGKTFVEVIKEAIDEAKCVVVLWSDKSIKSEWVQEEATIGKRRKILVPACIDTVDPPLGFGLIQAANLTDWKAGSTHSGFSMLLDAISEIVGPSPLKAKEAEEKRVEEDRIRKQEEERERQEEEKRTAKDEHQRLEKEKQHLDEEKRKYEEQQKRIEATRKAEEERKQMEAETKRKTDEERKRREVKAEIKTGKPEPAKVRPFEPKPDEKASTEPRPFKPRKTSSALKYGILAGVVVLMIAGIWWWISKPQIKEVRGEMEKLDSEALNLENAVAELDKPELIEELYRQRDTLSDQIEDLSEQATNVGFRSQLEELKNRLKQIQIQLENKEKELFTTRRGKIFVVSAPDNATVTILNIDQGFRQGMELEPGKYHLQVSSEGYEPQDRWIEIGPGEEKQINFELKRITPQVAWLHVETVPEYASVKILNIEPKFSQGMELQPGSYHLEVGAKGHEKERRWIEIGPGEEKRINFELRKIIPKVARLYVETAPEDAAVRILNIKLKFSQGMELKPGSYHVELSAEGYRTERRWIDLVAGHEEPFRFELVKITGSEQTSPELSYKPADRPHFNPAEPWTGKWEVEGFFASGTWVLKQNGSKVVSTEDSDFEIVGKVEGNYFKGRYLAFGMARQFHRFQVYISSDNMTFKGTTTGQAFNRPLKGRRKE